MRSRTLTPLAGGALLISSTLVGCWGNDRGLVPVSGEVYLDDEPVEAAAVMFFPEGPGRPAWAHTDDSGSFELTTYRNNDGAALGAYKISVTKIIEEPSNRPSRIDSDAAEIQAELQGNRRTREIWVVPKRYSDAKASGIAFNVESKGDNHAVIKLQSM